MRKTAATVLAERQEEQQARNELFAGREEVNINPSEAPLEDQTVDQLVDTAVRTHKDTTAVAQRALKVVHESKQIQAETMRQLEAQNKTMYDIGHKMDDMNAELSYAEKLLSYMRRCCCCWLCDSCTGADPEDQRKRDWRRRVDRGETQVPASGGGQQQNHKARGGSGKAGTAGGAGLGSGASGSSGSGGGGGGGSGRWRDPDIRLPEEHRAVEMGLHQETRKQNDMIDQIHAGLEQLLEGAKGMTDELSLQNRELESLDGKVAATHSRINDVNKNSQLRNMARGKPKGRKADSLVPALPSKSSAAAAAAKRLAGI
ncbi:hypothetical protein Agub_g15679 [Astrephomene gubernaculifera]|uniref:Uncharacterized protein n=1 Tax=Astrephomene gubernaculifera TaxID=47775 RepID=A0AAD3E5T2_9CHLO|nr:hypothetical protein Agub_g15679 [Astrephomene gubernaculifera]